MFVPCERIEILWNQDFSFHAAFVISVEANCLTVTLPERAERKPGVLLLLGFGFWRLAKAGRQFFLASRRISRRVGARGL